MKFKQTFILTAPPHPARQLLRHALEGAPDGMVVTIQEPNRTLEQNTKMWALLHEVSVQVDWYGQHLTPEEWKDVFTAALKRQKVVPGIDGGFVVCGQSTSQMGKKAMAELMEVIYAFGSEKGVVFKDVVGLEGVA